MLKLSVVTSIFKKAVFWAAFFLCLLPPPTYAQPASSAPLTFNGHECAADCSENESGYNWAFENNIDDITVCAGQSAGFVRGCQSWLDEKADEDVWQVEIEGTGTMAFE